MSNNGTTKYPVTQIRFPVNLIGLAGDVAANRQMTKWKKKSFERLAVKCGSGKATEEERDAFYEGIVRLIIQRANNFAEGNPKWYDLDDLTQACFARIWETLHMYRPEIAAVSTWTHFVCNSILCRTYAESKKYHSKIHKWDDYTGNSEQKDDIGVSRGIEQYEKGSVNEDQWIRVYMRTMMRKLFNENKDSVDILQQMFGDPFVDNYEPPAHPPTKADIARNIGRDYAEVYAFFKTVIKPFFEKHFRIDEN